MKSDFGFWRFEPRKKSSGGNKGTAELLSYLLKQTMNRIDRVQLISVRQVHINIQ